VENAKKLFRDNARYKMIDINRVHKVLNGEISGRGCGMTTAMLVKALGYADYPDDREDFPNPNFTIYPIEILCENFRMAEWTMHKFIELAKEMKFEQIDRPGKYVVIVNYRRYIFGVRNFPNHRPDGWRGNKCFVDTAYEFLEIN
jgi:hypothetical protein